jgi:hypothetical protein
VSVPLNSADDSILVLGIIAILGQHFLHYVDVNHRDLAQLITIRCSQSSLSSPREFAYPAQAEDSVLATILTLPIKAATGRRSASYVFT